MSFVPFRNAVLLLRQTILSDVALYIVCVCVDMKSNMATMTEHSFTCDPFI